VCVVEGREKLQLMMMMGENQPTVTGLWDSGSGYLRIVAPSFTTPIMAEKQRGGGGQFSPYTSDAKKGQG
jgi:hypothetical protein